MVNIEIRRVQFEDLSHLQAISKQTFLEAFAEFNEASNMQKYLESNLSAQRLQAEIQNENSAFYFATIDALAIGYLKVNISKGCNELQDESSLELERLYVLKEFYGKGIGQKLVEHTKTIAKKNNITRVWLGVWENNLRAIHFYKKEGFIKFGEHDFLLGDDLQTDILMQLVP